MHAIHEPRGSLRGYANGQSPRPAATPPHASTQHPHPHRRLRALSVVPPGYHHHHHQAPFPGAPGARQLPGPFPAVDELGTQTDDLARPSPLRTRTSRMSHSNKPSHHARPQRSCSLSKPFLSVVRALRRRAGLSKPALVVSTLSFILSTTDREPSTRPQSPHALRSTLRLLVRRPRQADILTG